MLNIVILLNLVTELTKESNSDDEKEAWLFFYAMLWAAPMVGIHYLRWKFNFWETGGILETKFQTLLFKKVCVAAKRLVLDSCYFQPPNVHSRAELFRFTSPCFAPTLKINHQRTLACRRKFLNYTEASRSQVRVEKLVMAMTRDVETSVHEAYLACIELIFGQGSRIVYLLGFMVYLQTATGSGVDVLPLLMVLSLPLVIVVFLSMRQAASFGLRQKCFDRESDCLTHVLKSVLNFELVAGYVVAVPQTSQVESFESVS